MSNQVATEKTCTKCGKTKPLIEFYPKPSGRFGVDSRCQDCRREYQRKYSNPPKIKIGDLISVLTGLDQEREIIMPREIRS